MTQANMNNFCGGNFTDWLEVLLTERCNGKCSWCVEKRGYHPKEHAEVSKLVQMINTSNKQNILLLGGEPLLFKDIKTLISQISNKNIYITTNGSMLKKEFIKENLIGIKGLNISIHHYDLIKNQEIVGIKLSLSDLIDSIKECQNQGIEVRFNCNLIGNYIDSDTKIYEYIDWAKSIGANRVRFAELKFDDDNFVDLTTLFGTNYGLNNNPFIYGCNQNVVINDMPVNFRQMCGFQTSKRVLPDNPEGIGRKEVLYYDGKLYDGWQIEERKDEDDMTEGEIRKIVRDEMEKVLMEHKNLTTITIKEIERIANNAASRNSGGYCQY
jgi:organic radical activating enzyme